MVTLEQLVIRVALALEADGFSPFESDDREERDRIVKLLVRATIDGLGLVVAESNGEVYDPAPKPVVNYPYDAVERGQLRRRRFRR